MKHAVKRFAWIGLFALSTTASVGCEQPVAADRPDGLEGAAYNMDGAYNADVHVVYRNDHGESSEDARIRIVVHSYGPATEAIGVPMLAVPNKLVTDLEYDEPFDVNFAYFQRTLITGELTETGGYFQTRYELYASENEAWEEQDWTITNLVRLNNPGRQVRQQSSSAADEAGELGEEWLPSASLRGKRPMP